MTVKQLSEIKGFKALALPSPERTINGVYTGDLLSWVMGRASEDDAWITIMSNVNTIAVATLADVACIILAESVEMDQSVLDTANAKGVNILNTDLSAYQTAKLLISLGL